jgi:TRAP-type mannitol/chloroaromatic compound transport system permease small subunit
MHWLQALADTIDRANDYLGRLLSWLALLLVVNTALVAVLRYVFGIGWVWMQDSYLWLFGAMFMLGAGYTLLHNQHVRVDFVYVKRGPRFRAWVDLLGTVIFLIPTVAAIAVLSVPFVARSWDRFEGSLEAGGLPGVYLLKSVLILSCIPLAAQALSMASRAVLALSGHAAEYKPGSRDVGGSTNV